MQPCGLINLDKPSGMTSRDAVNAVQRLLPRRTKIGHAGTLDPLASGVLVLCIGRATRLIEYVQRMPKRYRGTFLLGRSSPTEDIEGDVSELPSPPVPTLEAIVAGDGGLFGRNPATAAGLFGAKGGRPPRVRSGTAGQRRRIARPTGHDLSPGGLFLRGTPP